ncbi:MAG TPA: TonB-dependent receptor [Bryobacteraceae bacterium]
MRIGLSLRLVVFLTLLASLAFGQVGNGTITGTVVDPVGAVVANAMIQVRNTQTGVLYTGATTNAGVFTIADLPIGTYSVSTTVTGFKTYTHTNLALGATQVLSENITLEVGTAAESVTVTAESSLLKTESAELSTNVNTDALDALPLVGIGTVNSGTSGYRNPYNSVLTLPGVSGYSPSGTFEINGLGQSFVTTETMRIEGQDATDRFYGSYDYTQMAQPSVDAIQEIAYQVSNYAPEFGQAGSLVINMTMKSGTNQYHGTGYDYFVNEDLNAGQAFTRSGGCLTGNGNEVCSTYGGSGGKFVPRNRRNDFGGTLGGPISIPHIYNGRNKSFFFFNYEEFLETDLYGFNDTVPTSAYLGGNFGAVSPNGTCSACTLLGIQKTALGTPQVQLDPNGQMVFANEIFDPASRTLATSGALAGQAYATPFPNNVIPTSRFDPVSQKILSFVPAANNANFTGNYVVTQPGHRYSAIPAFKLDQIITPKDRVSFYYSENTTENQYNPTLGSQDGLPTTITAARGSFIKNYQERLNYDRTISPTLLLHVGVGMFLEDFVDNSPELTFNPLQTLGLSGFLVNRNFPTIAALTGTSGTGGMQSIGTSGGIQDPTYEPKPTASTNLTWVRGKHTYKAGAEWIYENFYNKPHPTVTLTTGANATGDPFTNTNSYGAFSPGFPFASFLLGDYTATSQGPPLDTRVKTYDWAFFVQDSWKVTRKLTLDYGVRWDYDTPEKEQFGRWAQLDATVPNPVAGGRLGALQFASNCNCAFYKSAYPYALGPRLGVAYQITPKTVFRGGWGLNYQFIQAAAGGTVSSPGTYNLQANSPSYIPTTYEYVNDQTPGFIQPPTWPITNPYQYPNPGATSPAPTVPDKNENRPPRIDQWSAGFQREITRSFVMEASYVANRAAWLQPFGGSLGFLSQLSPQYLATYGLYPMPGTGPCSSGTGVCSSSSYNNQGDRALLSDPLSSSAVIQRLGHILPYSSFPTSSTLSSALVPFPQFGAVEPTGSPTWNSKYDSLQAKATKRFSHGLVGGGSFTWAQGFNRATRQDFFNPSSGRWVLQNIPPLNLNFNANYTVPKASFLPKYVNAVTKDWQIGFFANYQSGAFLTPPNSTTLNYLTSEEVRVPGQPLYTPGVNINDLSSYNPYSTQVLNPNAWQQCPSNANCTAAGTLYKDFRAPRTPTENANIARNFRLGKEGKYVFQLRAEFVNIFNRTIMPAPYSSTVGFTPVIPQTAPSKNQLGIYTSGWGIINTYLAPNTAYALPTLSAQPIMEPRQGTLIGRFSF